MSDGNFSEFSMYLYIIARRHNLILLHCYSIGHHSIIYSYVSVKSDFCDKYFRHPIFNFNACLYNMFILFIPKYPSKAMYVFILHYNLKISSTTM